MALAWKERLRTFYQLCLWQARTVMYTEVICGQVHVRRAVDLPMRPRKPKAEEEPEDEKERQKFQEETKRQQEEDKKLREHNLADSCDPLCQVIIGNSSGPTDNEGRLHAPERLMHSKIHALSFCVPECFREMPL